MTKDNQFADSPSDVSPRFDDDSLSAILSAQIKDSLRLDGHAVAQVWYSVLLDGSRTETGVIDSGQTKTWRAEKTSESLWVMLVIFNYILMRNH